MLVVLQHAQLVLVDLGVGRIDVDHVDLSAGHRFIGEPVVEAARRLRQPVGPLQTGPAVAAAEELVRQPEAQLRMLREIAEVRRLSCCALLARIGERVGIVETQRHGDAETKRRQPAIERCESRNASDLSISRAIVPV